MRCRTSTATSEEVFDFPRLLPPADGSPHGTIAPMFALFEEAGKFQAGRVLSEAESSAQVELDSGKRVKVKAANILLKFEKPSPAELMREAQALAADHRPGPGLGIRARRRNSASPTWRATISARRPRWRSRRRRCFACSRRRTTSAAPARAASRRRRPKSCSRRWPRSRRRSRCRPRSPPGPRNWPPAPARAPIREQLFKILFKPDKNAPEYKAVVEASRATHTAAAGPAANAPARSPRPTSSTGSASCSRTSPRAPAFPPLQAPAIKDELPLADVQAFSIDDSSTTEIDDALSVQGLGSGTVTVGIHIAAPGLALQPASAIDQVARAAPVHGLHAGLQDHHAARRRGAGLHAAGGPRLSRRLAVRDLRRSHAGAQGHARPGSSACRSRPTCATTSSMPSSPRHGWKSRPQAPRLRRSWRGASPAAVLPVPAGAAPQGAARGGARQARELQPARLQLPPGGQRRRRTRRRRDRCRSASASAARRWT